MNDVTTWFRVTLWRNQAENAAKYLTKGSSVYIEGRLKLDEWTDRDGNVRTTLDVQATDMHFIGGAGRESGYVPDSPDMDTGSSEPNTSSAAAAGGTADDDIPF
jgi:single-strand DNA-binding protein